MYFLLTSVRAVIRSHIIVHSRANLYVVDLLAGSWNMPPAGLVSCSSRVTTLFLQGEEEEKGGGTQVT
jgi:hypothetical protein